MHNQEEHDTRHLNHLVVVEDVDGNVLSLTFAAEYARVEKTTVPKPLSGVEALPGQTVRNIELDEELRGLSLLEIHRRLTDEGTGFSE